MSEGYGTEEIHVPSARKGLCSILTHLYALHSGTVVGSVVRKACCVSLCVPHHSLTPIARASHSLRSQAGDLIDNTIGVRFGLATLTAAAYGQVISDVSGVMSGGVVEAAVTRAGLPVPNLTQAQKQLRVVRFTATGGAACGVVVGCLLGMLSLFFLDLEAAERQKRAKELETIFVTVMGEGHRLVAAERCALFLVDHEKQVRVLQDRSMGPLRLYRTQCLLGLHT